MATSLIEDTIKVIEEVMAQSHKAFYPLSAEKMNWKPNSKIWSAAQCLDHLITAHSAYFPIFEQVRKGEYRTRAWERVPLLPVLFGRSLVEGLSDEANRFKAPAIFQPSLSDLSVEIVPHFLANQKELIKHIGELRETDLGWVITSPVTRLVIYSLCDTCRIIAAHETLHLRQAIKIMELHHSSIQ